MMLRFASEKTIAAVIKRFDNCGASPDRVGLFIADFGSEHGAKAQATLLNTLYQVAQQRGYNVSGTASLGNTISIQHNDAVQRLPNPRCLTENQVRAVANDLFQWTEAGRNA